VERSVKGAFAQTASLKTLRKGTVFRETGLLRPESGVASLL
jgi:hypothetical protein